MSDEELNEKVANVLGVKTQITQVWGIDGQAHSVGMSLPDYCHDLNVIREAVLSLPPEPMTRFGAALYEIVSRDFGALHWNQFHDAYKLVRCVVASARQETAAFYLAMTGNGDSVVKGTEKL